MNHLDGLGRPNGCECADSANGVVRVPPKELHRLIDWAARSLVLVAPVRLGDGLAREVEVEVAREAGRSSGTRENHPRYIPARILKRLRGDAVVRQELTKRALGVPGLQPRARVVGCHQLR